MSRSVSYSERNSEMQTQTKVVLSYFLQHDSLLSWPSPLPVQERQLRLA